MQSRLNAEQVREVLARAETIQQRLSEEGTATSGVEEIIRAAEEAGLSREAVELALTEHLDTHITPPAVGELVFALSTDNKFYVAEVLELGPTTVRVRFLNGGEKSLSLNDLRPCSFVPGSRVDCPWPHWGWWTCTVISYDEKHKRIRVSDGWSGEGKFGIDEVRLSPPRRKGSSGGAELAGKLGLLLSGGIAGALIHWLVTK